MNKHLTFPAMVRTALAAALLLVVSPACMALGNYEIWHTEGQDVALGKQYTLALRETFRWRAGGELYHQEYDLGVLRQVSNSWKLGLNYRQVYTKNSSGDIEDESRPQLIGQWKHSFGRLNVESNNRLEYRFYEHKSPDWRYRNKATAQLPFQIRKVTAGPYVSDEIFVKLNDMTFVRNRFYCGLLGVYGRFSLDLYYLHQDSKNSSGWTAAEVLGSALKIAF